MKHLLCLLIPLLFLCACKKEENTSTEDPIAQEPNCNMFDGNMGRPGNSTIRSIDNQVFIIGRNGDGISILKTDGKGNLLWRNNFGIDLGGKVAAIVQASDGDLFLCGHVANTSPQFDTDVLLVKATSAGDTIWTRRYGGAAFDAASDLCLTSDGNLLVAGFSNSFADGGDTDLYLIKLNKSGVVLWSKIYSNDGSQQAFAVLEMSDGGFLISGMNPYLGMHLMKINKQGFREWEKTIELSYYAGAYSPIELSNENILVLGRRMHLAADTTVLVLTDSHGNTIWQKDFGEGRAYAATADENNVITFTGRGYGPDRWIFVRQIDEDGNELWLTEFGLNESDFGGNIIADDNDGFIITGKYFQQIFMTRLNSNGNFIE